MMAKEALLLAECIYQVAALETAIVSRLLLGGWDLLLE